MIIGNPPKSQSAASMPAAGDRDVSDGGAAENGVKRLFKFQRTRLAQDAPREPSALGQLGRPYSSRIMKRKIRVRETLLC